MNAVHEGKLLEKEGKINLLNEAKGSVKDIECFDNFGWINRFYEVEGIPIGILRFTSKGKSYIFV